LRPLSGSRWSRLFGLSYLGRWLGRI
jgi:hypothetical protein